MSKSKGMISKGLHLEKLLLGIFQKYGQGKFGNKLEIRNK